MIEREGIKRNRRSRGAVWMLIPLHRSFFFAPLFGVAPPPPPPRRPPPRSSRIARRLSLAGELHPALRGPRLSPGEGECLFISLFPALPKGAEPLKMVNGLWFRSVCAPLSYLIKYLRPLIGPGRSRPGGGGGAPRRSARVANGRRPEGARGQKLGMDAGVRPLWFSRGGYLGGWEGGGVSVFPPLPP